MTMKRWILLGLLLSISSVSFANELRRAHCPSLRDIQRTPGEYGWKSTHPGWSGQFFSPTNAKGASTHISTFLEARWIALNNLPTSPGYIQCDYLGNS